MRGQGGLWSFGWHRLLVLAALIGAGCGMASRSGETTTQAQDATPFRAREERQVAEYPLGPIEDADGNLWLGSVANGAMMWNGMGLRDFHAEDGLVGDRVTGLTRDGEGTLWFVSAEEDMGGSSALMIWDGAEVRRAEHPHGFPPNPTRPYFDASGALWVQSNGRFHREVNGVFEPFPLPESLPRTNRTGYEPMNVRQTRNGDFWFGTSDQGAIRWDGEAFHPLTTADGLPTNNVHVHLEDRDGNLWLSCFHWHLDPQEKRGALCRWDGETVTTFPDVPGLTGNEIYSVYEDRDGNVWIGATCECIYRYDGATFQAFTRTEPERPDFPFGCNSIYQDRAGRMWFGLTGGLYRLDGDVLVNVRRGGPWD